MPLKVVGTIRYFHYTAANNEVITFGHEDNGLGTSVSEIKTMIGLNDTVVLTEGVPSDELATFQRIARNQLLIQTDNQVVADRSSQQTNLLAYRQSLRDLSNHANWPDLNDDDWPTQPEQFD